MKTISIPLKEYEKELLDAKRAGFLSGQKDICEQLTSYLEKGKQIIFDKVDHNHPILHLLQILETKNALVNIPDDKEYNINTSVAKAMFENSKRED